MCKNQVFRQTIEPKFDSCHRCIAVLRILHACASATPHRFSAAFKIGFSWKGMQDTSLQLKLPCFQLHRFSIEHGFTMPQSFSNQLRRNHKKYISLFHLKSRLRARSARWGFKRCYFFCQVPPLLATVPRNPDGPRQIHRFPCV